ncbi:hypothetical protein HOY80DRAFT_1028136 [Tuber brumale]|nr:hypothetical protein HOY80DRAFT_1028136 [Tuber brumale]
MEKDLCEQNNTLAVLENRITELQNTVAVVQNAVAEVQNTVTKPGVKYARSSKELMISRPLQDTAVDIRGTFFATYHLRKDEIKDEDRVTIRSGKRRAPAGDVCLDVYLIKNHALACEDTFYTQYGLPWFEAQSLLETTPSQTQLILSFFLIA